MPTTLSSGVVMTGAAGGNMAHALMITIFANALSVFTIPVTLSLLLKMIGTAAHVSIDKTGIMIKLGLLVIVPLCAGLLIKFYAGSRLSRVEPKLQIINQCFILAIVWMAMSQTREAIITGKETMGLIVLIAFLFHLMLLAAAWGAVRCFDMGPGRRESILFMGGQKTLTLSIILQVSLFPQYGLALAVCVLHHIIHLMMDGYLVEKLKAGSR
jgi:sodium/bile acid cotransporter 7